MQLSEIIYRPYTWESTPSEPIAETMRKAEKGDAVSCWRMANYFYGHEEKAPAGNWKVIKRDFTKSIEWAKKAASLGCTAGYAFLGNIYSNNESANKIKRDYVKAAEYYRTGYQLGDNHCGYELADLLMSHNLDTYTGNKFEEALEILLNIISQVEKPEHDPAYIEFASKIGECYSTIGEFEKALEWYQKASRKEFHNEIRELQSIIRIHRNIPKWEKAYEKGANLPTALKAAKGYFTLVSSCNQYQYSENALKWMKLSSALLECEQFYIDSAIKLLEPLPSTDAPHPHENS